MKILSPELPQQPNEYRNTAPALEERTESAALYSCDFARRDLAGLEFAGVKFVGCKFTSASFRRADFCDTVFENCDFSGATLRGASFRRAILCGCKGMGADFSEGYFADARVEQSNFSYANFSEVKFRAARFFECDLADASLANCAVKGLELQKVRLAAVKGLELQKVRLARAELYGTLFRGVDLTDCDLTGVTLSQDLHELRGATVSALHAAAFLRALGINVK